MEPESILVPTDFSDMSRVALAEGARIARRNRARLTVLHVHPLLSTLMLEATAYNDAEQVNKQIVSMLREKLHKWTSELRDPVTKPHEKIVLGTPVEEIVKEAAKHDLLVIATHGRTGLSHFLMGSVAERVVRAAPCPVLVLKQPPDPMAETHGQEPKP